MKPLNFIKVKEELINSQPKSHTYLQFAQAYTLTKNCKRATKVNARQTETK